MNFSHLRFAATVASTGSFTAAAARCSVTQPTLSNGIAQLENELGGRLFVRTTRKVSLTPFGDRMLPHITAILDAQEALLRVATEMNQPGAGDIRIGATPLISAPALGSMLEDFRRKHPRINCIIRQMNVGDLEKEFHAGNLDFIFTIADARAGSWVAIPLYQEPLFYVPRGASWGEPQPPPFVDFRDVADHTFVMLPNVCGLARTTQSLFRQHRRRLRAYAGEAMSYQVLEEWAVLGMGAAILPRSKVTSTSGVAAPIRDKAGRPVYIAFEARWQRATAASHLRTLAEHLRSAGPDLLAELTTSERANERASERANERASDKSVERTIDRTTELALVGSSPHGTA